MDVIINIFKNIVEFFYNFTGDYGIAIVLLTITVKIILLPFSIKQRVAMKKQITFTKKIEGVKVKYKNNKKKQEDELNKLYMENSKGVLGCLLTILQLPIISGLYMSINRLQLEAMSILVPWAINIGDSDDKFLVPIIYTLVTIAPSIISYLKVFDKDEQPTTIKSILPMIVMGILITVKSPIALGIYFITSGLFSLFEDLGFKIYSKNRVFS
ncbi:membrane protein insertase YidC [uncultured Clostridium sp.]|uniref:membrane protein insertase YidC n=1 Tax=uncultured Clostridium sp. TaxID=59620 RepID=UPI0025E2A890|nr:membrane protein insertase YidC [uncultured Clostridium sp.]